MSYMTELSVQIAGAAFKNPVMPPLEPMTILTTTRMYFP
jgi:hypothetical protein